MLKVVGGTIFVLAVLYLPWTAKTRSTRAIGVAARRGLSPFRIPPPYSPWGIDARCDMWTLCGAFMGAVLGLGLGWGILDSLPLGIVLSVAGAPIVGWRYRVVASLLAVERHAHGPVELPAEEPRARESRPKLALVGVMCGVAVALVGLSRVDAHGAIAVVGFVAIVLYVAWRVMRILDRRRPA